MDENKEMQNREGSTEPTGQQEQNTIYSDSRIYPPRQESSAGYGATGYGGEQGKSFSDGARGAAPIHQQEQREQPRRDYGVDPLYGAQQNGCCQQGQPGSGQPNLHSTFEWNFAGYDQPGQEQRSTQEQRRRGMRRLLITAGSVLAVCVIVLAGYSVVRMFQAPQEQQENATSAVDTLPGLNIQDKPQTNAESTSADGTLSNVEIIKKVSPAVVGIECFASSNGFSPIGMGSGIIMTADGYIVTNAHVVSGAAGITVMLENGDTYAAQLVGSDPDTDLAVIKIEAQNLTYAEFGNSDELERGEPVIAIGNPGGTVLSGSTTGGMISGLNRNINSSSPYGTSYIQVDAAINPGNSGGALVNQYGQVIGINSAKIAETDYEGIGFAIPINEALPVIQELMEHGYVTGRAALGIRGFMINDALASMRRMPEGFGIESVEPGSDLNNKNVAAGDIITHINNQQVTSYEVIENELAKCRPGDTVRLKIYRPSYSGGSGRSFEVDVVLIESGAQN